MLHYGIEGEGGPAHSVGHLKQLGQGCAGVCVAKPSKVRKNGGFLQSSENQKRSRGGVHHVRKTIQKTWIESVCEKRKKMGYNLYT